MGQTLVIEDEEECNENEGEMEPNYDVLDTDAYYSQEATRDNGEPVLAGRQFAVLRDGRLHLSDEQDTVIQEKVRALEQTLSGYDEDEDSQDQEAADDAEEHDELEEHSNENTQEENEAITGRNLVTGQTISLRGFMEKMRRREQTKKEEFVTVRPVNSRVVVGRTSDGKRLVGKIIHIQKKVQPLSLEPPALPTPHRVNAAACKIINAQAEGQQQEIDEKYYHLPGKRSKTMANRGGPTPHPTSTVSEQVARTLAGLMTLQTVRSSIGRRKLLVRHVQKRSAGGKVVAGSRRVAYYSGVIRPTSGPPHWKFISDPPTSTSIDLPTSPPHPHTVTMLPEEVSSSGPAANCYRIKKELVDEATADDEDLREPLTLHLTETHDEHGVKKTRVSIPQLGGCNAAPPPAVDDSSRRMACAQCGKRFHTGGAMRRHQVATHGYLDEGGGGGKKYTQPGDLNEHLRTHEPPLPLFDCSVCHKQFNRHSNLLRHALIHRAPPPDATTADLDPPAKGPPFVCTQCECQYNYISSLTRHIVTEHKTTA